MEYYKSSDKSWQSVTEKGNPKRFQAEHTYINYFAEKLAESGGLGDVRYAIIEEGENRLSYAISDEEPDRIHGIWSQANAPIENLFNEYGIHA